MVVWGCRFFTLTFFAGRVLPDVIVRTAFATCPAASKEQAEAAVQAAHTAFQGWAATPIEERQKHLAAARDVMKANKDELAE